ncbi:MAG: DUF3592 domain-containing protein, partial [Chthonomonadales bacterium]
STLGAIDLRRIQGEPLNMLYVKRYLRRYGIALFLAGIGVAIYFVAFDLPRKNRLYGPESVQTTGTVASKSSNNVGRRPAYLADISYKDEKGSEHSVTNSYPEDDWNALRDHAQVTLRYVKADPDTAADVMSMNGRKPNMVLVVVLPLLMMIIGFGMWKSEKLS